MRLLRVLLAGSCLAVMVAPFAAPAGAASGAGPGGCGKVLADGDWLEIPGPRFSSGPQTLAGYAVDPQRPHILWATNGAEVAVSRDSGCSYERRFALEFLPSLDIPISAANATIRHVVVPERASGTVLLAIEERLGAAAGGARAGLVRPHILVSNDGGKTWRLGDGGLPATSQAIIDLKIAPSDPSKAFMLIGDALPLAGDGVPQLGSSSDVYASEDGGRTWARRGRGVVVELHVDPLDPRELWFTGAGLYRSVDGGRTLSDIDAVASPAHPADVFRVPGSPARILVHQIEGGSMGLSEDGGRSWTHFGSPNQIMLSLAHGAGPEDIIMSNHQAMWRFQAPRFWVDITPGSVGGNRPKGYENVLDLQVDRSATPSAWGYRPSGTILRYQPLAVSLPPLIAADPAAVGEVDFGPDRRKVKIEPGGEATVTYRLDLPAQPTPLDVFFLMDTTVSMDGAISGLLTGIHEITAELARSKIDVQFGVGEYKDYPIPGWGDPVQGDFPYRLNRAIGPADQSLVDAIERMEASGGGRGHYPESQLTALYQAATGEGEPGFVAPGQQAGFRSEALKVIVHITDASFDKSAAHPSPPFDVVARELKAKGILQVGLVTFGESPVQAARADLVKMAEDTGTFAPNGLEGCFQEGTKVTGGMPLTCDVMEDERGVADLAAGIVGILRGLTEQASVSVSATEGASRVQAISPEIREGVDMKDRSLLSFDVTFTCPALGEVSRTPVELVAAVDESGVAAAEALVVCSPLAAVKDKVIVTPIVPPPPIVPQPAPAAIVPPPAPPAPPAPVTNTQPQPNPNMQGAMAHQEEQQAQVALASQEEMQEEELLAFSSLRREDPSALPLYLAAAAMVSAASALALRTRNATRAASVRRRA